MNNVTWKLKKKSLNWAGEDRINMWEVKQVMRKRLSWDPLPLSSEVHRGGSASQPGLVPYLDNDHLTLTHIVSSPHGSPLTHQSNRISTFPSPTFQQQKCLNAEKHVSPSWEVLKRIWPQMEVGQNVGWANGDERRPPPNYLTQII